MNPHAPVDTLERLLGTGPPIPTSAWSLGDPPLRSVLAAIEQGARTVAECGSGRSTVVIARRLAELNDGSVHALEHDLAWAQHTRAQLAAEGLLRAEVISAPLEPNPLAGDAGAWYSRAAVGALPDRIDLLLIDGPPAGDPELRRNREPALAELAGRLAPGAWIVLDDAGRPGELEAMATWARQFGLEFEPAAGDAFATARWPVCSARWVRRVNAQTRVIGRDL